MDYKQFNFKKVAGEIGEFLYEYNVEGELQEIIVEQHSIDYYYTITDPAQLDRTVTWLQNELKAAIKDYTEIEISAPHPKPGKEKVLLVRIWEALAQEISNDT